jgi:isoquinoline 1-oxidoreductase beta subunit
VRSSVPHAGISRRTLLVGGGAGVGLAIAWMLWPRSYRPNLRTAPGESLFNAFLKIGRDGRVIVAVPQAELGQGVYTSLPQILADELGADWRSVSVEPAPISPLYANQLLAGGLGEGEGASILQDVRRWTEREYATRNAMMLTGGSTSVRAFEPRLREAGAAGRALLSMAAAERWGVDWEQLDTANGFVVHQNQRLAFAEIAEAAAGLDLPEQLPVRSGPQSRLTGRPLPRLDAPAKIDGTAVFAGDIRLPDLAYASVRAGPIGNSRLVRANVEAANRIPGVLAAFREERWAGAAATNWWLADRAVRAMNPVFETRGALVTDGSISNALGDALAKGAAARLFERGDPDVVFAQGATLEASYSVSAAPSAAPETLAATARLTGGRLEVWAPTQALSVARAAAARVAGLAEAQVTVYPTLVGGGYGRKLETIAIEQAVIMATRMKRPVQLVWSRTEESIQDGFRPPARAMLSAKFGIGKRLIGWRARIAAPSAISQMIARVRDGEQVASGEANASAVEGATPPYAIPAVAVDHVSAEAGLRTGIWRSGAHSYNCFFTESFVDELARKAGLEPLSFRIGMLGDNPRLARVLSTATALGGWDGGAPGSVQGLAAHSAFGSHVALLVEAAVGPDQRIRVSRAVCAVDCGRVINPEIVRQLIEGGIIHGISAATGNRVGFDRGLPTARTLAAYGLPRLADTPEITVEIIESDEPPGGVTELAVPPVAPAIANAIFASTGQRLRSLPLTPGSA